MEKKKRLGRGLDEVADLWLSSTSTSSGQTDLDIEQNNGFTLKTISIIFPDSLKIKGFVLTNLTLELAKLGYGSCILDYGSNMSPITSVISDLFQNTSIGERQDGLTESHQVLRLYGMPSIHIFSNSEKTFKGELIIPLYSDSLFSQIKTNNLQESIIFLAHHDTLEAIITMQQIPSVLILVSKPRKESLLITYAYIKTIFNKSTRPKIWIIMDESSDAEEGLRAFSLLNDKTKRLLPSLGDRLKFLGSIIHDETLQLSLSTHFPLVLAQESSPAKEGIYQIANNIIKLIGNSE